MSAKLSTQNRFKRWYHRLYPLILQLATKEIWRNKGRYLLISGVVALLTTLVLFISGLNEGLAVANRQYIENIEADLLIYQADVNLSIPSSQLGWSDLRDVRRVKGVEAVGPIGLSSVTVVDKQTATSFIVNLIGVEPEKPGMLPVEQGQSFISKRVNEVVIDKNVADRSGLTVGDTLTIKSLTGTEEEVYDLHIAGISPSQLYFIQPAIFVPYLTWQEIKPKVEPFDPNREIIFNIIAVQLEQSANREVMIDQVQTAVNDVEVVGIKTAYEATPGYLETINILNIQRIFILIIGTLVVGGFFQIQTLQKVAQVGVFKAIGASSRFVIATAMTQIMIINLFGVAIGSLGALALTQIVPSGAPILFESNVVIGALALLLLIGPMSGLLSIRTLLRVEPLTALGLAS